MEDIYYDPSWSSYKSMWTRSSKDHSFAKSYKSITKCINWYKESDKVIYPDANTLARIDVPIEQLTNEYKICLKHGRPVDSKNVTSQKRRTQEKLGPLKEAIKMTNPFKIDKFIALEEAQIVQKAPKETHIEREAPEETYIET